jgi:hypothetical protein
LHDLETHWNIAHIAFSLSFDSWRARDVNREPTDLNLDLISYRGCADTRREREREGVGFIERWWWWGEATPSGLRTPPT